MLLEQVVQLAKQELELIAAEQDDCSDELRESANRRNMLLRTAWEAKDGCNELEFLDLLQTVQQLQNELDKKVTALKNKTKLDLDKNRDNVNTRKKTVKGILGYCTAGLDRPQTNARIFRKFS
ncbi:hypothetical protein LJB93_00905 [Desulfovibrio sp. OttesenSCG-928-F07]|nr:hypothetical protein [Desulfovibrio sp. OttesenSCG-928-F07]